MFQQMFYSNFVEEYTFS